MRTNQMKLFRWLLLPAFFLTSCVADRFDDEPGDGSGQESVRVKFALQMPNGNTPGTYAITEIDENEVTTIDVLAFVPVTVNTQHPSGYAFAYKAQVSGAGIVNKPGYNKNEMKEFTVTLLKKTETQNFVILANVRDQVDALGDIAVGADKDEVLKRLEFANAGSWNANNGKADNAPDKSFVPFPMWGEVSQVINDATTQITGGKLLRGIARLDVVLGNQVLSDGNFYLEELYIYNSKNKARIVPDAANFSDGKVTTATLPAGSINNGTPLLYEIPSAMKNAFERSVYLFEAKAVAQDNSSEATCMVIGGRFGSDTQTSYYRLDFFQADGKTYKDVLRNHHYRVNITKVQGRGEASADEAFNSKAINMQVQITEWNDGDFGSVTFDGQYYLAVSPRSEFDFSRLADSQTASIKTDVPAGLKITKITESDGTTPNSGWLTTDKTTGSSYGAGGANVPVDISVTKNTTSAKRTGHIYIKAGRLEARITVTQDITTAASLDVTSGGEPITVLSFASNDLGPKTIDISWFPQDADLEITNSAVDGYPAFPTTSGIPTTGTVPEGNSGTGKISYTITAPTLTDQEKAANPFMEKMSKLSFLVDGGSGKVEKTILVRYINYALTTDLNTNGYLLDNSKTHSITIKSNSLWEVYTIDGNAEIVTPSVHYIKEQRGGNNIITGDKLTFKLITDTSGANHGKTITIILSDPTGKVPNTVLVVKGISCGVNGTAVLKRIGEKSYLTHMYGDKCWMVQNSTEGTFSGGAYGLNASGNPIGTLHNKDHIRGPFNGHYYTYQQAAGACPAGWHLPTADEVATLMAAVNTSDRDTNPVSKWWTGKQGTSNGAFAGFYFETAGSWHNWGGSSDWWYGTGGQYLYSSDYNMATSPYSNDSRWFSVRCVQN